MSSRGRRARTGVPEQLERQFQEAVLEAAEAFGWTLRYHTWDSRHSAAGYPDLTLCRPRDGRLLIAELKRERGEVSEAQRAWLDGLDAVRHFETRLWRPSDWDEIVRRLR